MKVCPVCNEAFGDELNFCDLDGTKLIRQRDASSVSSHKNPWPLLGVGLLVGALILSAVSIIFLPKARVAPTTANSVPAPTSGTGQTTPAESGASSAPAEAASGEIAATEEMPPVEVKKRDKNLNASNANLIGTTPNPKAAALSAEDNEKAAQTTEEARPTTPEPKAEPPATVKTTSDTREAESTTRATANGAEVKKDPKKQTADARKTDTSNNKKKDEEKDEKKKGGFLRVFKKIFGKD